MQAILGGRGDAGLVLAVEVDDVAVAVGRRVVALLAGGVADAGGRGDRGCGAAGGEECASGEGHGVRAP